MTATPPGPTLTELTAALRAARPALDADARILARALYRRLAIGSPVADTELAADTALPLQQVRATIASWPGAFRDHQAAIVGFWGLTIADLPPHRYHVGDARLSTWCAWDPLFLTPILDTVAQVHSVDAHNGEPLHLTITPDRVTARSHPDLVLSFLDPAGKFDDGVIDSFCHYVHLFTDSDSGQLWTHKHPGTFLLTLDDAFTLASHYARDLTTGGLPAITSET